MDQPPEHPRQRVIIYTTAYKKAKARHNTKSNSSSSTSVDRTSGRDAVVVPTWFDLPLLATDSDRQQYIAAATTAKQSQPPLHDQLASSPLFPPPQAAFKPPKVSLLGSPTRSDRLRGSGSTLAMPTTSSSSSSHTLNKTNQGGVAMADDADGLRHAAAQFNLKRKRKPQPPRVRDRLERKSKLKDRLWRDLHRFGLWQLSPPLNNGATAAAGDAALLSHAMASVDQAAEAILRQWLGGAQDQDQEDEVQDPADQQADQAADGPLREEDDEEDEVDEADEADEEEADDDPTRPSSNFFLTEVPKKATLLKRNSSRRLALTSTAGSSEGVATGGEPPGAGGPEVDQPQQEEADEEADEDDDADDANGLTGGGAVSVGQRRAAARVEGGLLPRRVYEDRAPPAVAAGAGRRRWRWRRWGPPDLQ